MNILKKSILLLKNPMKWITFIYGANLKEAKIYHLVKINPIRKVDLYRYVTAVSMIYGKFFCGIPMGRQEI